MAEVEGAAYPKVVRSRAWDRKDLGQNLHASVTPIPSDLISLPRPNLLLFFYHLPVISSKCESIKCLVHWLDQGSYDLRSGHLSKSSPAGRQACKPDSLWEHITFKPQQPLPTLMWKVCHLFPAPCNLSAAVFSTHANYRASRFKLHSLSSPLLVPPSPGVLKGDKWIDIHSCRDSAQVSMLSTFNPGR